MRKRILIVDDDAQCVEILRRLLSGEYEVAAVGTGEACLEAMKDFGPDVVLLETVTPGIDGYETCQRIKSAPAGDLVQVIFLSSQTSPKNRLKAYEAGAEDFLVKPFDHDELLAKVRVQFRLRGTLTRIAGDRARMQTHNADLEGLVKRHAAELIGTQDVAVFALAKLAESRDPETGQHLERMRAYAQILAEQLKADGHYCEQVGGKFLEHLYRSSPLHDIGKVGIPDVILLKPDRLTNEEFDIMKRHTVIGADALDKAVVHTESGGFLGMAAEIARYHHERFNGTGYPERLAGQDIPLAARIVALADVYDALTSIRVYKSAYDPAVTKTMIEREEGEHFDPVVVDAFRARYRDFLRVRSARAGSEPELATAAPLSAGDMAGVATRSD